MGAIKSTSSATHYANNIAKSSQSVGSEKATKDDGNVYQGKSPMSTNIDTEQSLGEKASSRAIEFMQVLHGIHSEFTTTDAELSSYIKNNSDSGEATQTTSTSTKSQVFSSGTK